MFEIDENKYLIDENGEMLCEANWEVCYPELYSEGLLAVKDHGRYGYLDENGNVKFQLAEDCYLIGDAAFHDGLAPCFKGKVTYDSYGIIRSKQGAYGYIDTNGNFVIDCQFEDAEVFSNGLAAVQLKKRYGFIDNTGNIVIQPQWVYASNFNRGGFTMVSTVEPGTATWEANLPKRKDGLINKKGEMVLEMKYDMCYEDTMSYREEYSVYVAVEDDYNRLIYLNNETGEIILDRIRE